MKVLICGSRAWRDYDKMRQRLERLSRDTTVITGGARGADTLAEAFARAHNLDLRVFLAAWNLNGRSAGIVRNLRMLDENPDLVIAFWDGKSRGTAHTISEAEKRGIPVEVIRA